MAQQLPSSCKHVEVGIQQRKTTRAKLHEALDPNEMETNFGSSMGKFKVVIGDQTFLLSKEGWGIESQLMNSGLSKSDLAKSIKERKALIREKKSLSEKLNLLVEMLSEIQMENRRKNKPRNGRSPKHASTKLVELAKVKKLHAQHKKKPLLKKPVLSHVEPVTHTEEEKRKVKNSKKPLLRKPASHMEPVTHTEELKIKVKNSKKPLLREPASSHMEPVTHTEEKKIKVKNSKKLKSKPTLKTDCLKHTKAKKKPHEQSKKNVTKEEANVKE